MGHPIRGEEGWQGGGSWKYLFWRVCECYDDNMFCSLSTSKSLPFPNSDNYRLNLFVCLYWCQEWVLQRDRCRGDKLQPGFYLWNQISEKNWQFFKPENVLIRRPRWRFFLHRKIKVLMSFPFYKLVLTCKFHFISYFGKKCFNCFVKHVFKRDEMN